MKTVLVALENYNVQYNVQYCITNELHVNSLLSCKTRS